MDRPEYRYSTWHVVMTELESGEIAESIRPDTYAAPGAIAQLFTVGATLAEFGSDSTVETAVHRTGPVAGGRLDANLVLVGASDMNLGSRGVIGGPIEFDDADRDLAPALPMGEPLAGLDDLAGQVKFSGINEVRGEVIVDDRMFTAYTTSRGGVVSPISLNDNLIDVVVTPTAAGSAAAISQQPFVSGYAIRSRVMTGDPGTSASVGMAWTASGGIEVTGSIPVGAPPLVRSLAVQDPAAFARAAFIDALRRAGIVVDAVPGGPSRVEQAPDSYSPDSIVAKLRSATLKDEAKIVLKAGFARGSDLLACRLAVASGSRDCGDGLKQIIRRLDDAGIDQDSVLLADASGVDSQSNVGPAAVAIWLAYADSQRWGSALADALPLLGVDGPLADVAEPSPSVGHVSAIPGEVASTIRDRVLRARSLAGYMRGKSGERFVLVIAVGDVTAAPSNKILDDLGSIAALLWTTH